MTETLTIAAYRCSTGGTQITLSKTDENGRGIAYRVAGPKHHNLGTKELVAAELDESDAAEIRAMLDAVFPGPDTAEIVRRRAEVKALRVALNAAPACSCAAERVHQAGCDAT